MKKPRREFLAISGGTIGGLWLSGCVDLQGGGGAEATDQTDDTDMENTDTQTEEASDQANDTDMENTDTQTEEATDVEDVPELADPLPKLLAVDDRGAFVSDYNLKHRNGEIKVQIMLDEGAEPPDEHLSEVTDAYGDTVIAWIAIDELAALAKDADVALVSPYVEPKTDSF